VCIYIGDNRRVNRCFVREHQRPDVLYAHQHIVVILSSNMVSATSSIMPVFVYRARQGSLSRSASRETKESRCLECMQVSCKS